MTSRNPQPLPPGAIVIDARGLNCPLPVLRLRKRLKDLSPGATAALLVTDPAALRDVPAFCEAQRHEVLDVCAHEGATYFVIKKGTQP